MMNKKRMPKSSEQQEIYKNAILPIFVLGLGIKTCCEVYLIEPEKFH